MAGRKNVIHGYLKKIGDQVDTMKDPCTLDHVLSLLMQASSAMEVVFSQPDGSLSAYDVKNKFAPAQKNEVQLQLWKTTKAPGRKCKDTILRYYK